MVNAAAHWDTVTAADLRRWLGQLLFLRRLDAKMLRWQRQGRLGFYGPVTGQEAVVVALAAAFAPSDWVFPALRESGLLLLRGMPLTRWLAQHLGSADDVLKGRQMPSHPAGRDWRVVSWSSSIGTQLPQAVGFAWGLGRARTHARAMGQGHAGAHGHAGARCDAGHTGRGAVVLACLGDGATSTADFHQALLWARGAGSALPCLFLCQNNGWALSTPTRQQTRAASFTALAAGYGIETRRLDGMCLPALVQGLAAARSWVRAQGQPCFVEVLSHRLGPHSSSDDVRRYRSESEEAAGWRRDPVQAAVDVAEARRLIDATRLLATIDARIDTAWAAAQRACAPALDTLTEDVYGAMPAR
ncbi:MAG: thiamine pyrophosphate-dependent dehydrogenase E1 component subunit alpha [Polyangiales bacterium]